MPKKKQKDWVLSDQVEVGKWEEEFYQTFDHQTFWAELVAEWHQGDIDLKPFIKFLRKVYQEGFADGVRKKERKGLAKLLRLR